MVSGKVYILGLALTVMGCQTQSTLSLDEAKQVSTKFEGAAFVAPPRTVEDITKIIDQQKIDDPEKNARLQKVAKQAVPKNASKNELMDFYWERGKAANELGFAKQALNDSRNTARLWQEIGQPSKSEGGRKVRMAASMEILFGNYREAIRLFKLSSPDEEEIRAKGKGYFRAAALSVNLVKNYLRVGDIEAANKVAEFGEEMADKVIYSKKAPDFNKIRAAKNIALNTANIAKARGRLQTAETYYKKSIDLQNTIIEVSVDGSPRAGLINIKNSLADVYVLQNRLVEAESVYREGLTNLLNLVGKGKQRTIKQLIGIANILRMQGRAKDAVILADMATKLYKELNVPTASIQLNNAIFQHGLALSATGNWLQALSKFDLAKKNLGENVAFYNRWSARATQVPLTMIKMGRLQQAKTFLEKLVKRNEKELGVKHRETAEKSALLAIVLAQLNVDQKALALFQSSIPVLLSNSRGSNSDDVGSVAQRKIMVTILEAYIELLQKVRGTLLERSANLNADEESFKIADIARSQSVQGALAQSGARTAARDTDLIDLVRREQNAQKQIGAQFGLLANLRRSPVDQQDPTVINTLRSQIDELRQSRAALAEEIEDRFPEYAELINPKPVDVSKVQQMLSTSEVLISTYVMKDKTYVWAIPKVGKIRSHVAKLGHDRLLSAVTTLRRALDPQAETLGDIPAFNVNLAHRLYKSLLQPVSESFQFAKSLLTIPHGPLAQLPLSVLVAKQTALGKENGALFSNYKDVPWLGRTHAVTVLPSVASMIALRSQGAGDKDRRAFVGFGDPLFNAEQQLAAVSSNDQVTSRGILKVRSLPVHLRAAPATQNSASAGIDVLPRLPDTADEVHSMAVAMNADLTKDIFIGKAASEENVKTLDLSGYRVLAFATHGLVPGDLNGLHQPALALSSPKLTGGANDGLLTMGEILSLRLDADWVVLSACNTGAASGEGAEAFSGLGRAFFYAGTRAVLLSNWPVETTSARLLTTDLFKRQAEDQTLTRAGALQKSMMALVSSDGFKDPESGKVVFSYAHPIFWAPFSLVGDGGGGSKPAN